MCIYYCVDYIRQRSSMRRVSAVKLNQINTSLFFSFLNQNYHYNDEVTIVRSCDYCGWWRYLIFDQ